MRFAVAVLLAALAIAVVESRRPEPAGLPEELQDPGPLSEADLALIRGFRQSVQRASDEELNRLLDEATEEFGLDPDEIRREARERLDDRLLQDAAEDAGFY